MGDNADLKSSRGKVDSNNSIIQFAIAYDEQRQEKSKRHFQEIYDISNNYLENFHMDHGGNAQISELLSKRTKIAHKEFVKNGDGSSYDGDIVDGKRHGKGKFIERNGSIYNGEWKYDHKDGPGDQKYANGDIYVGEWKADQAHGLGMFQCISGAVYECQWENNKRHGIGKLTSPNGDEYE
eukprot:gene3343-4400_t